MNSSNTANDDEMSNPGNCDINTTGYCETHKQEGSSCMARNANEDGLEEILNGLYCRGLNDARPGYYKANGTELTRNEARAAISALIAGCMPEQVFSFPNQYNVDEMTGWNAAIDTITANLKAKGLL